MQRGVSRSGYNHHVRRRLAVVAAALQDPGDALLQDFVCAASPASTEQANRFVVSVPSSTGGPEQKVTVVLPPALTRTGTAAVNLEPLPLVVSLHTWGGDYLQKDNEDLAEHAPRLGWIYIFPDFQGPNKRPEACGSELVQHNVLEAVEWARATYPVDEKRIYLTGTSGGGHLTLLMAAKYPEIWAAACAFVGISDLARWHDKHAEDQYGADTRLCTGGAPGESEAIDAEYRARSPLTFLGNPKLAEVNLPLDILAGIFDGHTGSVDIRHSIDAFNAVAKTAGAPTVTEAEIKELSDGNGFGRLSSKQAADCEEDAALGREIHLRRTAGRSRLTIFEGGHEGIGTAAIDWLQRHAKE